MQGPTPHYPGRAPVDAYGNGGFRFADMSHRGSLIMLPSGIYAWPVENIESLTLAHMAPVLAEKDQFSFLLLGTGSVVAMPTREIREAFAQAALGLEIMDTGAACRTYNVLLAEGRPVAAALIAVA